MLADLIAQAGQATPTPMLLIDYLDAFGTLVLLLLIIVLVMKGDIRTAREVTAVEIERAREQEASGATIAGLRIEVETWRAAYDDQVLAREAAERSANNALESGRVVEALVSALRSASEG